MLQEKSPEVTVCNASLIRNVWEIRTKTYTQKLKTEDDRLNKSALKQINLEWQNRMTSERKAPPRLHQESRHTVDTALQNNLNKPYLYYMSSNTESSNSNLRNKKGLFSKRRKNIIDIYDGQPSLLKWGKSWKFSRPKLQYEEEVEAEDVSDWGKSWKFWNLQPNLEGQLWSEEDLYNDDLDFQLHNGTTFLSKEVKSNAYLRSQNLEENLCLLEWGWSWKFSKHPSHDEESLSEEEQSNMSIGIATNGNMHLSYGNMLLDSQLHECEMSEWRESWKVSKHQESDSQSVDSEPMEAVDHEDNQEKTSVSKWFESWMILYHELPQNKSQSFDWSESWKLLHVQSQQEKDEDTDEDLSEESLDIHTFENMLLPKRNKINMYLSSQDCSVSEWSRSWEITKPQAQALFQNDQKQAPEKYESVKGKSNGFLDFQSEKENCEIIKSKSRQFLSPQFFSDELSTIDWGESWKYLKRQSCQKIDTDESFISQLDKCAKFQHHRDGDISSKKFKIIQFQNSEWVPSWKFLNLPLHQKKDCWEKSWTKYLLYDNKPNASGICSEHPSKWGNSWKISNPHPPMENGSWLKAKDFHPQNESLFLAKGRCRKFLFSYIDKDGQFLRLWAHSWKLLKPSAEHKTKSGKSSSDLHTYIMSRSIKAKKVLSQLEKEKLSPRKWGDAWRLAKSQPRQKRGSWLKMSKETMNKDKTENADWCESWKFLYTQRSEEKSFMSEWEESWKYLITHQQESERERSK